MQTANNEYFTFTFPADIKKYELLHDHSVCVISIFGKSSNGEDKTSFMNLFTGRENHFPESGQEIVRGCYDPTKRVILLEYCSGFDGDQLMRLINSMEDFDKSWGSIPYDNAMVMLFLLQVSHIVLCVIPGLSLDTNYIRLFRALEFARNKLHLSDELSRFHLPKQWCSAGRPTCPRMLFLFTPKPSLIRRYEKGNGVRRLEHSLEDQIYSVLRKTRTITNNTNAALFALPANQPYVHIFSKNPMQSCHQNIYSLFDQYCTSEKVAVDLTFNDEGLSFKQFLMKHIELAHGAGFNDHVGRAPSNVVFEIGKLNTWFHMACHLYSIFFGNSADDNSKLSSVFSGLRSTLMVEQRFSDARCHKVMQLAENAYQENLPEYYTAAVHLSQLNKALHVMKSAGRGPALGSYLNRLEIDCTNFWKNGHQLCESISLSGHHCTHPLHRLPDDHITDSNEKLPCVDHSTPRNFVVACNCGRTVKTIGDLFNPKIANFEVYEAMARECCAELESIAMPLYHPPSQPANASESASNTTFSLDALPAKHSLDDPAILSVTGRIGGLTIAKLKMEEEEPNHMSDFTYMSLSQGRLEPLTAAKTEASVNEDNTEAMNEDTTNSTHSGYLSYMITNTSPKGLLPSYPSWSLTRLGPYSDYNPNNGIEQPGFLQSTNFLTTWEVVIKGIIKDQQWPIVGEQTSQKQRRRMAPKKHVQIDTTAKIYIGDGYICSKGHRFLMSAPDKVVKSKDIVNKLLTSDMPLYSLCPRCTDDYGQLRHIYIATPPIETIEVGVLPKIQPAPAPCPLFVPSQDAIFSLPSNGFWVMRLPHFYVDERGPYPLPADRETMKECRLTKGAFHIKNTSEPLL